MDCIAWMHQRQARFAIYDIRVALSQRPISALLHCDIRALIVARLALISTATTRKTLWGGGIRNYWRSPMRHNTTPTGETKLPRDTMNNNLSRSDVTPETLDNIMLRARQMRAEATADRLKRLYAAMARPFRHWTASKHAGSDTVIKGGPQGAI